MSVVTPPAVLVAVLNWGLGHAIRSIPVIRSLSAHGCNIVLAADGAALSVLQQHFPEYPSVALPGYNIRYPSINMYLNMGFQGTKILKTARLEYRWTQKLIERYGIKGLVSDARFGCFSPKIPSIFITHQVRLPIPDPFFGALANAAQKKLFREFDEVWIPDTPLPDRLAGKLSSAVGIPNARYIGMLSDRKVLPVTQKPDIDVLAILSGPEPQRSIFEQLVLQQARHLPGKIVVVQGLPDTTSTKVLLSDTLEVLPFLDREQLYPYISRSNILLSRSGYTTLMDLACLGKKAILVPTPGQTEQQYLAQLHHSKGHFFAIAQQQFRLAEAIDRVRSSFTGIPPEYYCDQKDQLLEKAIGAFVSKL